jgi:tetratricopeptide (TPR) repeat protein
MTGNYYEAKNQLRKAVVHVKMETEPIAIDIKAGIYYDLGSACYKLREFADARVYYEETVKILREDGDDDYWRFCVEGNLALARMQSGEY